MNVECEWVGKFRFDALADNFKIELDAKKPFGEEKAPSPKQYVLASICGCTGMDVLSILNKKKQYIDKFSITAGLQVAC